MLIITDLEPRGLGYVEIDNRAVGNDLPTGTPKYFEADTYTCSHCQMVVILNPNRKRERYKCKGCNHHICDNCAAEMVAGGNCYPFSRRMEEDLEKVARHTDSTTNLILP